MRHVIVSKDVDGPYTSAAAGALVVLYKDANGQPDIVQRTDCAGIKTADTEIKFGILKEAAATSLALLNETPWMKPSEVFAQGNFYARPYVAAVDQVHKKTLSAGTAGKSATVKIIIEDNYSMFNSYSFEFKAGGSAGDTCDNAVAAVQARLDKGSCPEIVSVSKVSTSNLTITMAAGIRSTFIFDAQDSTITSTDATSVAFAFGHGTYDDVVKKEKEQLGRDVSNYDRFTALPAEEVLNAVAGETYNSYSFMIKNPAEGQIRGVDNTRHYQLYVPGGDVSDALHALVYKDGESGSEHSSSTEALGVYFDLMGAVYAELNPA